MILVSGRQNLGLILEGQLLSFSLNNAHQKQIH